MAEYDEDEDVNSNTGLTNLNINDDDDQHLHYDTNEERGKVEDRWWNCYFDWGDYGGKCYDCTKLEPCCGSPVNWKDALYCCCMWTMCYYCTISKFFASSVGQPCAVLNHCLPFAATLFLDQVVHFHPCGTVLMCSLKTLLRNNLRRKHKIGYNMRITCGDCFIGNFCCFGFGQECRAASIQDWDWYSQVKESGILWKLDEWKFRRDFDDEALLPQPMEMSLFE